MEANVVNEDVDQCDFKTKTGLDIHSLTAFAKKTISFKCRLIQNKVCLSPQYKEETYLSQVMQITYLHLVKNINYKDNLMSFSPSPVNKITSLAYSI